MCLMVFIKRQEGRENFGQQLIDFSPKTITNNLIHKQSISVLFVLHQKALTFVKRLFENHKALAA
jgi:hypothetical protein